VEAPSADLLNSVIISDMSHYHDSFFREDDTFWIQLGTLNATAGLGASQPTSIEYSSNLIFVTDSAVGDTIIEFE
jgi:hypothetical protein